ncbi:MAG: hypothetical protein GY765_03100 [bacterium]|nr:hypothetical protein [bacterium]
MKKTIMILAVMVIMVSGLFGAGNDRYTDGNFDVEYGDEYGHDACDSSHESDEYAYRQMDDYMALHHYNGRVYYYAQPTSDIFFALIGRQVYIVPGFKFRRSMHRSNFYEVAKDDFVYYSCGSMNYYDSYMRFGFFNDYYYNNPWSCRNHRHVCSDYYGYYGNRRNSRSYYRLQKKVLRGYHRLERKHRHSHHRGYVKRSKHRSFRDSARRKYRSERRRTPLYKKSSERNRNRVKRSRRSYQSGSRHSSGAVRRSTKSYGSGSRNRVASSNSSRRTAKR